MTPIRHGMLCAAAAWLLLQTSPALAAFSDVPADHPNADAIAYVQAQGIVSGYPDGTYRPDQPINRAEFTKIIVGAQFGAASDGACAGGSSFADIPAGAWYAGDVCLAKEKGVIAGYPDGTFKPDANVNFAEAAKIIVTAFSSPASASGATAWYAPFVRALDQRHAIPVGVTGFDAPLTRGQMAEIIYRLKTNTINKEYLSFSWLESLLAGSPTPTYVDETGFSFTYPKGWIVGRLEWPENDVRGVSIRNTTKECTAESCPDDYIGFNIEFNSAVSSPSSFFSDPQYSHVQGVRIANANVPIMRYTYEDRDCGSGTLFFWNKGNQNYMADIDVADGGCTPSQDHVELLQSLLETLQYR